MDEVQRNFVIQLLRKDNRLNLGIIALKTILFILKFFIYTLLAFILPVQEKIFQRIKFSNTTLLKNANIIRKLDNYICEIFY